MKYKNINNIVDAIQFTGKNLEDVSDFVKDYIRIQIFPETESYNNKIIIHMIDKNISILPRDYSVKDSINEFVKFDEILFEKNYEKINNI